MTKRMMKMAPRDLMVFSQQPVDAVGGSGIKQRATGSTPAKTSARIDG